MSDTQVRAATEQIISARAGARNVAGVTFQGLVACGFLAARDGPPDVLSVVPEGHEDVDVIVSAGRYFAQVKQRTFKLSVTELAEALSRSEYLLALERGDALGLAVVTDAPDLDGVSATGWSEDLGAQERVVAALVERVGDAAEGLAARSHLVQVTADIAALAAALEARRKARVVFTSHLAAALLLSEVQAAAVRNRDLHGGEPASVSQTDVDSILHRSAAVEGGLLQIEADGVIAPTAFRRPPRASRGEFLNGMRARPWHIAAGYAVDRPETLERLAEALSASNAALIVGPSGSGKSTLMWQYAHSTLGRCFTVSRLSPEDVDRLGAFVEVMTPTGSAPLILCADDVGQAALGGWPRLVERFAGDERILLLGTCREEAFTSTLTGGGTARVLTPVLTEVEAEQIGRQLPALAHDASRTSSDFRQIRADADGLMMEFVHIATTNRHLTATLADQLEALQAASDDVTLDVLRLIAAADASGLTLAPRQLRVLGVPDRAINAAVRRLDGEFIVRVEEDGRLAGLHPLRSRYMLEHSHESLPTQGDTFAALISAVELHQLEDAVLTAFRLCTDDLPALEQAVAQRLSGQAEAWPDALPVLLRAEGAAFAPILDAVEAGERSGASLVIRGKVAGRMSALSAIGSMLRSADMRSLGFAQGVQAIDQLNNAIHDTPDPRPVRRNVLAALTSEARVSTLDLGLSHPTGLAALFGSDALDDAAATHVLDLILERQRDGDAGESVARLAAIGPTSVNATARRLGAPLDRLTWVLDRLVPLIELRAGDHGPVAQILTPAATPAQELEQRLWEIATLAHSVAPEFEYLWLEAQHCQGGELAVAGLEADDLKIMASSDKRAAIAQEALATYEKELALRRREGHWSSWLFRLTNAFDQASERLEGHIVAALHERVRLRKGRPRSELFDRAARSRESAPVPPPPATTADDPPILPHLTEAIASLLTTRGVLAVATYGPPEPSALRRQQIGFEAAWHQLAEAGTWLARFHGSSAIAALRRLLLASRTAAWLQYLLRDGPGASYRQIAEPIGPAIHDAAGTVSKLAGRIDAFEQNLLDEERPLITSGSFEVHIAPPSYRGAGLPAARWLLIDRNERSHIDGGTARRLVNEAPPSLAGRIVLAGALPAGPLSNRMHVWAGPDGWTDADALDRDPIVRALPGITDRAPLLLELDDVFKQLSTLSRRACAARLRGDPPVGAGAIAALAERIAHLPPALREPLTTLTGHVEAELDGRSSLSLGVDEDRNRCDNTHTSPLLELTIAAQLAATSV